jgi:hypothetical protein
VDDLNDAKFTIYNHMFSLQKENRLLRKRIEGQQ